jgi:hypothetical protein
LSASQTSYFSILLADREDSRKGGLHSMGFKLRSVDDEEVDIMRFERIASLHSGDCRMTEADLVEIVLWQWFSIVAD